MPGTTLGSAVTAGFFGKLPGRGDFIDRQLPKSFIAAWDAWLQAALARSRAQLGESGWREAYRVSPVWRFAVDDGVCGNGIYAGIMMPSMDRVGRYYPLTIAAPLPPGAPLLALTVTGAAWFAQAEALALAALEQDHLDPDVFGRQVAALGRPPLQPQPPSRPAAKSSGAAWCCSQPGPVLQLTGLIPQLADVLLRRALTAVNLWWTEGADAIAPCLLLCSGLPPVDGFAALLRGDWNQAGWNELLFANAAGCPPDPAHGQEI